VAVAAILAFLPYLAIRGPTNRIASALRRRRTDVTTSRIGHLAICTVLAVARGQRWPAS
jgi:hypothetical protein